MTGRSANQHQNPKNLRGVFTALITPFRDGKLDEESFGRLLQQQIQAGLQGFVINGTTAESPNLSPSEVQRLFALARAQVPASMPLIVGTGSNSTAKTVADSQAAEAFGADALLVVVPYYNKPPARGLVEHFTAVADAVQIPVILYNVPGRTITSLDLESIEKLSRHPRIVGIKEATGDIGFAKQIRRSCGPEFILLSGDDATYDEFMSAGGDGVISVASHVVPQAMLNRQATKNLAVIQSLFIEANPIPVKKALQLMGVIRTAELRLPLVELAAAETEQLRQTLVAGGVLK